MLPCLAHLRMVRASLSDIGPLPRSDASIKIGIGWYFARLSNRGVPLVRGIWRLNAAPRQLAVGCTFLSARLSDDNIPYFF